MQVVTNLMFSGQCKGVVEYQMRKLEFCGYMIN